MASGKEYKIAFKIAADLESSFGSAMSKAETDFKALEKQIKDIQPLRLSGEIVRGLHDDVKTLVTKMREVDALRIGTGVMKPLKDDIKDARDELHRLGSMRLSGDITRALEANVDGLETKLRAISHLRIGANVFENMKRDIADVDRQIRALQAMRITGEIVRPIRTDLETLERQLREIVRMNGPRGTFQEMKDDLKVILPDLREMKRLLTEITRIRMPSNQFGGDIERYVRQIRDLEAEMRRIQNMRGPSPPSGGGSGDPSGDGGGPSILALGSGGLMAGAAAIGGAVMIGKASEDYQVAMKQIQASTGATTAQMDEMKSVAKNLYNQNIGDDWYNLASVMGQAKQVTQQTGAQLQNTTRNAVVLEKTFENLDVTSSLKTAQTMARNFGVGTDQAFNLFAQGAQKGLDYSGELLDSANEYATYFAKIGFSAEDMFNTFSAGMENGAFNLDKVGDAIKEFGIRSKDGSKSSAEAYKSIGLNATQMTAKFAQGGEVAQKAYAEVGKALAAVKDPVVQNAAAVGLFGTQAEDLEMRTILALTNVRDQYDMTADTMGEITKIKYSTLGQAMKGIGRQLNTAVIIPLTEAALPALSSFSNWFSQAGPKVSGFFKQMGGSKGFSQVKTFATDAIENVKYLFENGFDGEMVGVTENYAKMLGMDPAAAADVGKKAQALFKGVQAAVAQFRAWIGPATEQARATFQKVFVAIGGYIKQAIPIVLRIGSIAIQAFQQVVGAVAPFVSYLYGKLQPVVSTVFGFIANTAIPGLLNAFNTVLPHIQGVVSLLGPLMTAIFNAIKPTIDAIVAAFQWAWPLVSATVKWAVDTIGPVIGGLLDALGGIITFLTGVFSGNWSQAWNGIVQTFGGIWSGLKAMVAGPINAVVRMVNNAIDSINSFKVDMPEVLGGGTIGFNIGHIPEIGGGEGKSSGSASWGSTGKQQSAGRMQAFARGGIADRASIFGEAGPEMAIPLNNSPRSHSLLEQTNRMMGHDTGGGQPIVINFAPVNNIEGNVDRSVIEETNRMSLQELKSMLLQLQRQGMRVSL